MIQSAAITIDSSWGKKQCITILEPLTNTDEIQGALYITPTLNQNIKLQTCVAGSHDRTLNENVSLNP